MTMTTSRFFSYVPRFSAVRPLAVPKSRVVGAPEVGLNIVAPRFGGKLSPAVRREAETLARTGRPDLAAKASISFTEWVSQFETKKDQRLALKLLEHYKYFDIDDIRTGLVCQHQWLEQQPGFDPDTTKFTHFAPGKSGGLMLYFYRQANDLPNQAPMSFEMAASPTPLKSGKPVDTLVVLDDFLGTGREAEYFFNRLHEALKESGQTYKNVYFLPIIGYQEGLDYLKERFPWVTIHSAQLEPKVLDEGHPRFTPDEQKRIEAMLNRYPQVYPPEVFGKTASPFGYRNGQALLGFFFNTPSNTLPIFWSNYNGWKPLFPRYDSYNANPGSDWQFPNAKRDYWA